MKNCCAFEQNYFEFIICIYLGGAYPLYDFFNLKYCTTFMNEPYFENYLFLVAHSNLNFKNVFKRF